MIKFKKFKKYFAALLMAFAVFFTTVPVLAAELYVDTERNEYNSGDTFIVNLKIDVQGECINAVKADISFSNDLLEAVDFIKSDSILIFWAEESSIDHDQGRISFAGGVPGGYCGKIGEAASLDNLIGKVVFRAKGENLNKNESRIAEIKFLETSEVFLNDGAGTKANLSGKGTAFKIKAGIGLMEDEWQIEKSSDGIFPEPFKIEIENDPMIFDGKYFIIFNAFDKQTGIGHYEIKEGDGQWQTAKSPYLLTDQSLKSAIIVKAVDKAGNERLEELDLSGRKKSYKFQVAAVVFFSLMILILAVFLLIKLINKKSIK